MTEDQSIVVRVAGESGEGIITVGDIFTRIVGASGYWIQTFRTFPAEILGGHVVFQVRVGRRAIHSVGDAIDVVVALNQEACREHHDLIRDDGTMLYDSDAVCVDEVKGERVRLLGVPMNTLAREIGVGAKAGKNLIMIGVMTQVFGLSRETAKEVVIRRLGKRKDLLEANLLGLKTGYEWSAAQLVYQEDLQLGERADRQGGRLIVTGNQALAMGALAAGLKFFAGYPITPASEIMEFLAGELPKFGGMMVQAEDEMAAIAMCLGASFSGQRVMTATSGPGMALMLELLGHASMTEVPVVLVDVQRAGPSTGMPTKTAQADLWMALYGGNDEAPRIVIAPGTVEDCFYQTVNALNMAERYQMPVVLLSDQALSSRLETIVSWNLEHLPRLKRVVAAPVEGGEAYLRYKVTESGISPMAIPGTVGACYTADGLEHMESGAPSYDPEEHQRMTDKRWRKLETAYQEYREWPNMWDRFGDEHPDVGVICWGATEGAVREAVEQEVGRGRRVGAFVPKVLSPLPREELLDFVECCKAVLVPELNSRAQFASVLRAELGIDSHTLSKYQGLPFTAREIEAKIDELYEEVGLPTMDEAVGALS
jgi:2-oxoglutarate ferredoxin oxidoreductase subunit alpha